MSELSIANVIIQIERDFSISIERSAHKSLSGIPEALRPLYEFSDGLELPFGEVYKWDVCNRTRDKGWVTFGFDNYESHFLCHETDQPALTTWDHHLDMEIEGCYASALEWLVAEYEEFIAAGTHENTICVFGVPNTVSKTGVVAELKRVSGLSSTELLALLRSGNFEIKDIVRADACRIVRALQELGVKCHVVCDA